MRDERTPHTRDAGQREPNRPQHQLPVGPLISSAEVRWPELASVSRMALADNAALGRKPIAGLAAIRPPRSSSAWVEIKITRAGLAAVDKRTRDVQAAFTCEIDVDQGDVRPQFLRQAQRLGFCGGVADNHHALSLEQAARGGEEPPAVVDDEAPCVHNSSLASGPLVRIPASRTLC